MAQHKHDRIRFLRVLTLSCAVIAAAASAVFAAPDDLPGDLRDRYPEETYLVRLGSAETSDEAADQARFEIASYFQAEVSGERLVHQWYKSETTRGEKIEENLSELTNTIIIKAERDIPGIEIAHTEQNSETELYDAWAVLDKDGYVRVLRQRIETIDTRAERLWQRRGVSDFERVGDLKRIVGDLALREKYIMDILLLEPGAAPPASPVDPAAVLNELDRLIADEFNVGVVFDGDVETGVRSAIVKGAVDAGIRVKGYDSLAQAASGDADLALTVSHEASFSETSYNQFNFHNVSWVLTLSLVEPSSEKVIESLVLNGKKAGAQNPEQARDRMIREIITNQVGPVNDFVYAAIFNPDEAQ